MTIILCICIVIIYLLCYVLIRCSGLSKNVDWEDNEQIEYLKKYCEKCRQKKNKK